MICKWPTLAGLVWCSCVGSPIAQAAGEDVTVTMSRRVHPVLIRNEYNILLQIVVDVQCEKEVRLQAMHFLLDRSDDVGDLASLALFATGDKQEFSPTSPFGKPMGPVRKVAFRGDLALRRRKNVFWLSGRLKPTADLSHRIAALCTSVETTAGKLPAKDQSPGIRQRIGIALRKHKDDGVHTYRIPALATTPRGTLLCVYDMRRRMGRDLQEDIDIGLSRSTDGGSTWEPQRVIMDMGKYGGLPEAENGCSDPGILVDQQTGESFCFAVWMNGKPGKHQWTGDGSEPGYEIGKSAQFLMVRSKDDGRTWSKPENLTRKLKKEAWWLFAPSPQQGINLADGTLVMPAEGRDEKGKEFSTVMTSRDHGATWIVGAPAYSGGSECQAVQLGDGSLMLNMRNERERFRAVFVTRDLGKSWQAHATNRKTLIEPNCNGSLLRVDYTEAGAKKHVLLFANPHSQKGRTHQTIQVSFDDGRTWPEKYHLLLDEGRGAGYPSLTRIDDRHVGIVYEGSQAQLVFEKIPLDELLKPAARSATAARWKHHLVRRLGGAGSEVRIAAQLQSVPEDRQDPSSGGNMMPREHVPAFRLWSE
ncbi:MAG: exo-alpha-sialidase [Planctomycetes bacterium]|nr:exo-alpha-sialidase [Planctomycetota bacterium]